MEKSGPSEISEMDKALFLMGNHPAKLIATLALTTFDPSEYVTKHALHKRVKTLQARTDGWTPSRSALMGYCKDALLPLGYAELKPQPSSGELMAAPGILRLTQKGRQEAPVIIGALTRLELETIAVITNEQPLLQNILGGTYYKQGRLIGAPTRMAIYEAFFKQSPCTGIAQAELISGLCSTGLSVRAVTAALTGMYSQGILNKEDRLDDRIFNLSPDLSSVCIQRLYTEATRTVITAAKTLLEAGRKQVTKKEIIHLAIQLDSTLSDRKVRSVLQRWFGHHPNRELIQPANNGSHVTIPTKHREYIGKLVNIRRLLNGEDEDSKRLQETARRHAQALLDSPRQIFQLLWHAKIRARSADSYDWKQDLAQRIPREGVEAIKLYREVVRSTPSKMVYETFRKHLDMMKEVEVIERPRAFGRPSFLVTLKKNTELNKAGPKKKPTASDKKRLSPAQKQPLPKKETPKQKPSAGQIQFSKNWIHLAACKDEDPDLFYPPVKAGRITPDVQEQIDNAKRICSTCPVRLPCLKVAIESSERVAIRGGIWFEYKREELSEAVTKRVLRDVVITN